MAYQTSVPKTAGPVTIELPLTPGGVTNALLAPDAVTTDKIATGGVTGSDILDNTIEGADIKDGSISAAKLGADVVVGTLGNDGVTTPKILDSAVTGPKIAAGAITDTKLGTGSVTATKLAVNSVTEDKIADDSVTEDKIPDDSILLAKLQFTETPDDTDVLSYDSASGKIKPIVPTGGASFVPMATNTSLVDGALSGSGYVDLDISTYVPSGVTAYAIFVELSVQSLAATAVHSIRFNSAESGGGLYAGKHNVRISDFVGDYHSHHIIPANVDRKLHYVTAYGGTDSLYLTVRLLGYWK